MIQRTENVLAVAPPQLSPDGRTALLGVIPKTGPTDEATETLVHDVRDAVGGVQGAEVLLTGATAVGIDVSEKLSDALPLYLLLVVGLSLLLLMLVFRSILVPLKAALGFLLTVGATFGVTVAVFQQGHLADLVGARHPGPLVSFLPILLIGILFGLAMDYEVFLVSRMREEYVHGDDRAAGRDHRLRARRPGGHRRRADHDRPSSPASSSSTTRSSSRWASRWPSASLVDAFVVRMTLVPAVMSLLGRPRLVAAPLAGPGPAQRRHRGRGPARTPGRPDPHEGLTPTRSIMELWCPPCPGPGHWSGTTTP